ncbi:uncharacterized protein LOC142588516 isoform X1 [Dermacentor variabilis]|uniref:uncharacterized protein LOC142588516 isoform X1 n=1 Tax=Dermacentor variabilis TaxID=34621 RepID=UPI003F5C1DC9
MACVPAARTVPQGTPWALRHRPFWRCHPRHAFHHSPAGPAPSAVAITAATATTLPTIIRAHSTALRSPPAGGSWGLAQDNKAGGCPAAAVSAGCQNKNGGRRSKPRRTRLFFFLTCWGKIFVIKLEQLLGKKLQNNATRGGPPPSDAGPLTCWTGVPAATRGEGDKAWPLAVVLVAGSATVLGSVVLLVLSKKKRWQPGRSSPGHRAGLPAALLPSKGILVGASLPAAGAYDNSAFAENVAITGDGPPRASLLRQLQPPSLGGYRQLPHHQGPPQ